MAELPNCVVKNSYKNHARYYTGAQCVITVRNPEKGQAVKADLEVQRYLENRPQLSKRG